MNTIIIKDQAQWDELPEAFDVETIVEIRSGYDRWIEIKKSPIKAKIKIYDSSRVEAFGSSQVEAFGSSRVEAYNSSRVDAYDSSRVDAYDSSRVDAFGSSRVDAYGSSQVKAYNSSQVEAFNSSRVEAFNSSQVEAFNSSQVEAYDSSQVKACNSSRVDAYNSSRVDAYDSSRVDAYNSSRVKAYGFSQVVAFDSSQVEAFGFSQVDAFEFSTLILDNFESVRLFDYVSCRLKKDFKKNLETFGDSVTLIKDFEAQPISFETWLERGFVVCDGIRSKLISKKTINDVDVFTVKKSLLDDKESFVVRRGEKFSHGETVEKAIEDLRYKISDRDTSRFEHWDLNTVVPIEDAIESYRVITGACEYGVKDFVNRLQDIPTEISVKDIIEKTKGTFGNEEFKEFFK